MPLRLKTFKQVNPGGCEHYKAEMFLDGQIETREVSVSEISKLFENFPGGYRHALILGLIQYRLDQGVAINNLVGKVRIGDGD